MTIRHLTATLIAGAAVATSLTACGGQSLSSSNTAASGSGSASAASQAQQAPSQDPAATTINGIQADSTLSAKVPASIRSKGISLSTSVGYPPMEIWASDGKTAIGVDPSLARAIARVLGVKLTVNDADFNSQIPGLLTGRYDMIMSSMTDSKAREQKVSFVDYVQAGAGFIVKQGNPSGITTPGDMCGKSVSVVDNGSSLTWTQKYSSDCTKAGKPAITILRFTGDQDAFLALKSGRADANITDYVVAASQAAKPTEKVQAFKLDGTETPWGIALKPSNQDLITAVQGALNKLIANGDYAKILDAYHVSGLATKQATINKAIS